MQTTQNKTLGSSDLQNQKSSHVDNLYKNVVVTSIYNLTINHNKNRIPLKTETKMSAEEWNAMVSSTQSNLMFNKSLRKIDTQSRNCIQSLM